MLVGGVIQIKLAVVACVPFTFNVTPLTVIHILFLQTPDEEHAQYWGFSVEGMLSTVEVDTDVVVGFKWICVILINNDEIVSTTNKLNVCTTVLHAGHFGSNPP